MNEQQYLQLIQNYQAEATDFANNIIRPWLNDADARKRPNLNEFYKDVNNLKMLTDRIKRYETAFLSNKQFLKKYFSKVSNAHKNMIDYALEYGDRYPENYTKILYPVLDKFSKNIYSGSR